MSFFGALRRPPRFAICAPARRCYASGANPSQGVPAPAKADSVKSVEITGKQTSKSCCPENTVLDGLAYLKNQPPVLAQSDDAYPDWLWTLLDKKELPDDGPGGKAEKHMLRKQNKQRIRDQNFIRTQ
ncbi:mitochondrial/chloroplast ribosomal protein L54/L37 [Laetiporus sulphureus 93-53]|uniref:Large ribosomal subunit protein mL54 n=1 Tax=Laetiporus sulphureus 93-53 TaxID=1314785 RepID=A0A165G0Q0_9APHY|nr:mitochondrial/chloroplast ribosomal protein L54/L37 [Laetiporus sulphureus 93-53]KZT09675.1 mitochondrial/chloroplast ribosomal protein L54/L37 [Laetiporus sulphureus 93-53]